MIDAFNAALADPNGWRVLEQSPYKGIFAHANGVEIVLTQDCDDYTQEHIQIWKTDLGPQFQFGRSLHQGLVLAPSGLTPIVALRSADMIPVDFADFQRILAHNFGPNRVDEASIATLLAGTLLHMAPNGWRDGGNFVLSRGYCHDKLIASFLDSALVQRVFAWSGLNRYLLALDPDNHLLKRQETLVFSIPTSAHQRLEWMRLAQQFHNTPP